MFKYNRRISSAATYSSTHGMIKFLNVHKRELTRHAMIGFEALHRARSYTLLLNIFILKNVLYLRKNIYKQQIKNGTCNGAYILFHKTTNA
jgi:hypothetical protein